MEKSNFLLDSLKETFDACLETARKKNADYAGENNHPFANFMNSKVVGVSPSRGILVRMVDKLSRISVLLENEAQVKDESIEDTLNDLCNYSAILKAFLQYVRLQDNKLIK